MTRDELIADVAEAMFQEVPEEERAAVDYPGIAHVLAQRAVDCVLKHYHDLQALELGG